MDTELIEHVADGSGETANLPVAERRRSLSSKVNNIIGFSSTSTGLGGSELLLEVQDFKSESVSILSGGGAGLGLFWSFGRFDTL